MDFRLTDEQLSHRDEFFSVCRELDGKKPPSWSGMEPIYRNKECFEYHRYCAREFARHGWLSLAWPAEYGGHGDNMDRVLFAEARGYYGIPGVDVNGVQQLAPTLLAVGSEEMKRRFLPPIANAEVEWCELWSEPNAGSDLASLTCTAIKKGNEYIINGQKTWTSGAHMADWGFGVFKSDLTAKKHQNLSFLALEMNSPGITMRPIPYMTGEPLYNEVFFDDVHVPCENIIGQENGGWAVVNTLANFERSMIDQITMLKRALEELVQYCKQTKRNGKPLSKDPVVRNRLAQMYCDLEAAFVLSYRVADMQNRNELSQLEASCLKIFASDLGERFSFIVTDILGPYGEVKSSPWAPLDGVWEALFQSSFVYTISMGTNEIQKNIIAWYSLGLPRMK